jgi:hypothetical protein
MLRQQPYLDAGDTLPPVQGTVLLLTAVPARGLVLAWSLNDEGELEAEVIDERGSGEMDASEPPSSPGLAVAARTRSSAEFAFAQLGFSRPGSRLDVTGTASERDDSSDRRVSSPNRSAPAMV